MMYKRVLLVIGVAVLAALTGVGAVHSAGASQKSTVATAGPPANDVKLSANSTIASNSGCAVTAWVHNQNYSISGYLVKFTKCLQVRLRFGPRAQATPTGRLTSSFHGVPQSWRRRSQTPFCSQVTRSSARLRILRSGEVVVA